ncbi:MAG TPA: alpha/beta fold hydrolase [Corynebacteriales bacterium]|nr:alpha/beta fold hydrolase [Mycobacteriales bacterium]
MSNNLPVAPSRLFRAFSALLVSLAMVLGITATPAARAENVLSDGVPQFATAPDGYRVSYFEYGKKVNEAPTIVITGTWPWSSEVLEPLIRILSKDYHVVRYDQRGYGASSKPNETSAYTLEKLAREFGAVIDKVAPKKKVHVFGLEWGSYIYSEYAYLFRKDQRISSFTTLGQPSLDISSQRTRDAWEKGDNQEKLDSIVYNMRASFGHILGYTPVLPDLAILSGLPEAVINKLLVAKGDWEAGIDTEEAYYGRKMMKANLVDRQLNPRYDFIDVPLMQLVDLSWDYMPSEFVTDAMEEYTNRVIRRELRAMRYTIVTFPITMAEWTHQAVQAAEKLNPSV